MAFVTSYGLLAGESLVSLVSRFGRLETGMEPAEFLAFAGLQRNDVIGATPEAVERVNELTGTDQEMLLNGAYTSVGTGPTTIADFGFRPSSSAAKKPPTVLPACSQTGAEVR